MSSLKLRLDGDGGPLVIITAERKKADEEGNEDSRLAARSEGSTNEAFFLLLTATEALGGEGGGILSVLDVRTDKGERKAHKSAGVVVLFVCL